MPYRDIQSATARIDTRNTRYRFDLEQDIPWAELGSDGLHLGPRFLARVGIDAEVLAAYPEAMEMLQWSVGLEICRAFSALEGYLLDFVDDEHVKLGPSKSVMMLYQEERKHIALFDRYAAWLEDQHPEWLADFERHFAPVLPALINPYNQETYPEASARHCFFWLKTLFFEEYTVFLHDALAEEADRLKSVWLAMHRCHRIEEMQHVVTDAAYLDDLDMSSTERRAVGTAFWSHLDQTFELFLGVAASRALVRERFPACARALPLLQTRQLPIFRDLFTHPAFRHTRRLAPGGERHEPRTTTGSSSLLQGPVSNVEEDAPWTFAACLDRVIETHPERGLSLLDARGRDRPQTYGNLRSEALRFLDALRLRGVEKGDKVLLCTDQNADLVRGLWACFLGGLVPIPLAPPASRGGISGVIRRLRAILARMDGAWVVGNESIHSSLVSVEGVRLLPIGPIRAHRTELDVVPSPSEPDSLGLIQFSSGSTGQPKGVRLTQRQILHNIRAIIQSLGARSDDVFTSWLPLFHDMGLIGYHLLPIVRGCSQVLVPTTLFMRRPLRWLQLMHEHRTTVTASPNFGLRHVVDRVRPEELEGLDLGRIHCLLNGAEPVSHTVIEAFSELLSGTGFSTRAMRPAYGMAEASLCLTAPAPGAAVRVWSWERRSLGSDRGVREDSDGAPFVGLGAPIAGISIRVVDSKGGVLPQGVVGAVQARGPSLTEGYEGDSEQTAALYDGDWLRTGDRGVVVDDQLVLTGRDKDLIIVHGVNVHAHDLESVAASVEGVHPRRVAAFGVPDPDLGRDRVVLVLGLRDGPVSWDTLVEELQSRLGEQLGFRVDELIRVLPREIPRTTSGKLQRRVLQTRFEAGELVSTASSSPGGIAPSVDEDSLVERVRQAWIEALGQPDRVLHPDDGFRSVGGTSLQAAHVHAILEERLGRVLRHDLLLESETIREMADWLARSHPDLRGTVDPLASRQTADPRGEDAVPVEADAIAVVGLAVRLPGADDPESLWRLLDAGESRFRPVPGDRWDHSDLCETLAGRGYELCPTGAFLDDIFGFDPEAFSMSSEQAASLDPQLRIFLEVATEALEDAGSSAGSIGVFVSRGESPLNFRTMLDEIDAGGTGLAGGLENSTNNMVAAQLSRLFDLTGPAMVVQAACASSLVAFHQARRSLQHGECEQALVGGIELIHTPTLYHLFGQSGVLSGRGACVPFSDRADGFVPGEGAVAVVLKRLVDARRDGNTIHALIRGSAVGNDGRVFGRMAPNPRGQIDVMRRALSEAGVDARSVGFVETHGTATPVGDTVELRALHQVYGRTGPEIGMSSIKSNLGHLLAAAGLASLIKAVLCLKKGRMAPIAGFGRVNPRLDLDGRLVPLSVGRDWKRTSEAPRRAAVNSLGIGGTNCHVILEEGPTVEAGLELGTSLLCVSGQSEADLGRVAEGWTRWLEETPEVDFRAFCAVASQRSMLRSVRSARVVEDRAAAIRFLREVTEGREELRNSSGPLVFAFPGPGSQCLGMATTLLARSSVFAEVFDRCDRRARPRIGWSLRHLLTDESGAMDRIELAQPLVFAVSVATARWLESLGVRPDALIGHSAGEYAAAVVGGALTLEAGLDLLITRGQAMAAAEAGTMVVAFAGSEILGPLVDTLDAPVWIATRNAPDRVTLSGTLPAIEGLEAALMAADIRHTRLAIGCAAHTPLMAAAADILAEAAREVSFSPLRLPMYSSRTGTRLDGLDADYLREQLVDPVCFEDAVGSLLDAGYARVVELGGSSVLSPSIEATARQADRPVHCASVHRRGQGGMAPALEALGQLFSGGSTLRFGRLLGSMPVIGTPTNRPYLRRSFPIPLAKDRVGAMAPNLDSERLSPVDRRLFSDHRARDRAIAPAAWMLNRIFRADPEVFALRDVVVQAPLPSSADRELRIDALEGDALEFCSRTGTESAWTTHLRARIDRSRVEAGSLAAQPSHARAVSVPQVYEALEQSGMHYGPGLRTLRRIAAREDRLWVELEVDEEIEWGPMDPRILDGVFQAMAAWRLSPEAPRADIRAPYLGFAIGRIRFYHPLPNRAVARIRRKSALEEESGVVRCDIRVADPTGRVCLELEDFCARRMPISALRPLALDWEPVPSMPAAGPPSGPIAVFGAASMPIVEALLDAGTTPVFGPASLDDGRSAALMLRQVERAIFVAPTVEQIHGLIQVLRLPSASAPLHITLVDASPATTALFRSLLSEPWGLRGRAIVHDGGGLPPIPALWSAMERSDAFLLSWDGAGYRQPVLRTVAPIQDASPLRSDGVYWLTGGAGGIGRALARGLVERGCAQLVLTGRRAELSETVREDLRARGASVHYRSLDVTDAGAVRETARWIRDTLGRLDGVIHCAGIRRDGLARGQSIDELRHVMAPKASGGKWVLEAALEGSVDFVVFLSSLTALVPSPGQAAYAAANGALDALAWQYAGGPVHVMSIDYGPWAETGMVADAALRERLAESGLAPMETADAVEAFFEALGLDHPQVVISGGVSASALMEAMRTSPGVSGPAVSTPPIPRASSGPAPRGREISDFLRVRLGQLLRRETHGLDPHVRFAELGVDSLMAVQLIRAIEHRFGIELYPTLLFEHPTLSAFERHLQQFLQEGETSPLVEEATKEASEPIASPRALAETDAYVVDQRTADVVLRREARPLSPLGADEIAIRVEAWGVNFIDVLSGVGLHPVLGDPVFVPGHEVAGVVVGVGARVSGFRSGDRVMALLARGGYARRVTTPAHLAMRLPESMDFEAGASISITGLTAVAVIEDAARLQSGESILIQSAAGATGQALVQLARHHGATIFGTASRPEKLARLRDLGVRHPILYTQDDFVDAVRARQDGVDVIVDSLSGEAISKGLGILRDGGRFIELGVGASVEVPSIDPAALFLRNQSFCGVNLSRIMTRASRLARLQDRLRVLLEEGVLTPAIGHRFSFEEMPEAMELLRSRRSIGKIVLKA